MLSFLAGASAQAADQETQFETAVRPVLAKRCTMCHAAKVKSGGLSLDSRDAFLEGGNSGTPAAEAILKAIRGEAPFKKMPLGETLSAEEIQAIATWVEQGAKWPEQPNTSRAAEDRPEDFWSFRPIQKPELPKVRNTSWPRTDIDRFILAKLEEKNFAPAPDADKRTLLRRLHFDLTGLPPTPEDVRAFLADRSPQAYAKVVDRLLASPRYGERWGRHWLDIARYSDTSGDNADYPIPEAYLYRDWVIRAFNEDLSYSDFLRYQIAGDVLAREERDPQRYKDKTVATGFIALSHRFGNNKKDDVYLTIENTIDTLGRGVLGLTLRCARCHDHKFDPVTVNDYYGLYGIFASTEYPWAGASDSTFPNNLQPLSPDPEVRAEARRQFERIADYMRQINDNKYAPKPVREEYAKLIREIAAAENLGYDASVPIKERDDLLKKHAAFREFLVNGIDWLKAQRAELASNPLPCDFAFAVSEGTPKDAHVQLGGDPKRPGKLVPRQFVEVISNGPNRHLTGSGRLELANWLVEESNPLTRRVFVNRVWQWHFGRGLTPTSDNFGSRGELPSHPELLDYLASILAEGGWSIKALHRRILLSHTYQLSSNYISANADKDPAAIYLWRFPPRRLQAEEIRDAMLAVTGDLDLSPAGPHPLPIWPVQKYNLNRPFHEVFEHNRRSVYLLTQRLFQHPFLSLFDAADASQTTSVRDRSNLSTQALFLMNSPFTKAQAEIFAGRIRRSANNDRARIGFAFETAFGRPASESEIRSSEIFLRNYRAANPAQPDDAWTAFCRSLLSSNEFFFVQ